MFTRRVTLFHLLGFPIRVDSSWVILAVLVTWSLAQGQFPHSVPGLAPLTYWTMGALGAAGLFASIVLHELGHAVVARRYGIPIEGITLFLFGGVAEMQDEAHEARSEFLMAIAGPLMSLFLALVCHVMGTVFRGVTGLEVTGEVLAYLAWLNMVLAVFNMVPAFPLDGGRVLRAALWAARGNLRWATKISAGIGTFFGTGLVVLGVFAFVGGSMVGGLWWFMIGMFLRNASQMSYKQVIVRRALEGETLRSFMQAEPVTVPPSITVAELVEEYIYRYHYKMYPVIEDGRVLGCVTTREVKAVPKEEWDTRRIREILIPCSRENTVSPDEDAMQALSRMNRTGNSRFLVVEGERLVGIVALKDLLKFLSLKMDLEGDEMPDRPE